ncbi:hypothetical protein ACMFMG_010439 [Clarireedia jacksonii]
MFTGFSIFESGVGFTWVYRERISDTRSNHYFVTVPIADEITVASAASASATATTAFGNLNEQQPPLANVQVFTRTLRSAPPSVISSTGERPFSVNGDTFVGEAAALQRSCSVQHNAFANAANSGARHSAKPMRRHEMLRMQLRGGFRLLWWM